MGISSAELYNNLGLCCFFAQQYDMTLTCFQRALATAEEETLAEVFNYANSKQFVLAYLQIGLV